jgi:predicted TIM-barrel fold metal-dependent hydrolase
MTPERWLAEFAELPLKDSVRPKILLLNAAKLLGIELPASQTASNS